MIRPSVSARLRRAEIALLVIGCGFLGWASWDTVARIVCQAGQERALTAMELAAIVPEGDDDATLAVAAGHVPGTAKPGERGNVVLAGHRDSFFRSLRGIRLHDVIRVSTPGREDEYAVESTEVVGPKEVRVLASSPDARLTLVTCFPFGFVGHAPKRFVVRASLSPRWGPTAFRPGGASPPDPIHPARDVSVEERPGRRSREPSREPARGAWGGVHAAPPFPYPPDSRTSCFPSFLPCNMPMKASGADSSPGATSSRTFRVPSPSHRASASSPSGNRAA